MERKTVRFQRDKLYAEIWEHSISKIAKKYDVPYAKLREACNKANIPLPTQSYWGNLQVGKPVQKTPLPDSTENEVQVEFSYRKKPIGISELLGETAAKEEESSIPKSETEYTDLSSSDSDGNDSLTCASHNSIPSESTKSDGASEQKIIQMANAFPLDFLSADERTRLIETALRLHVNPELKKLYPVLARHKAAFNAWSKQHPREKYAKWNRDSYRSRPENEPPLWERISEETLPRVYRFLDPLYRAIESLGGRINEDMSMEIRNEHVELKITEVQEQTPHVLTREEQKQLDKYEQEKRLHRYAYEPKFRKYDYIPNGKLRISACGESYVRDTSVAGVEERIGEILIALFLQSEDVRIEREKREEAQRKAEEEKRQRELQRQKRNDEIDKLQSLINEADDYEIACKIRAYITAVMQRDLDTETIEWVAWAKAKADWYDPTIAADDPIFGRRNHAADLKDKTPVKRNPYSFW